MRVLHITDLFNPPGDPDDHFDLLTLLSIPGLEVAGVVIDHTVERGAPGLPTVAKAAALCGRSPIPCAAGLVHRLESESDAGLGQPKEAQAAVELILSALENCPDRGMIFTIVGSMRDLAAAYNREPKLFHAKTARLMANIGDSCGLVGPQDWNTTLDPAGWRRIMTSGLPVDWFPCNPSKGRGKANNHTTWWGFSQREFLSRCPAAVREFFDAEGLPSSEETRRHMWSTASLWEAARLADCTGISQPDCFEMKSADIRIGEDGTAHWSLKADAAATARIFSVRDFPAYEVGMRGFLENQFRRIGACATLK
ncbi:MAG: nucleoside hydrolase [Kiritimatiellia bacterium]